MKRNKTERQKLLVARISEDPAILIRDLAAHLNVSRETVRRDFDELSREGRLHRRYGGATFSPIGLETSLEQRQTQHIDERARIARRACSIISDNEVVMLGSGATTLALAVQAALRVPDHANLRPWRLQIVRGEARARLGDVFADALAQRQPGATQAELDKVRGKPLRAPLIIIVSTRHTSHFRV